MNRAALMQRIEQHFGAKAVTRGADLAVLLEDICCQVYEWAVEDVGPAPNWAGEFATYQQWVNKGQSWLYSPAHRPAICIDAKGRRCSTGADMMRALADGAFPVRFFWDCEPAEVQEVAANG